MTTGQPILRGALPAARATIPPPSVYGLPADKFSQWRPYQAEAAMRGIEAQKRFVVMVAPTGFGKSAAFETIARYGGRSLYLTVTKALQDQINRDFTDRFDVRGKNNYDCHVLMDRGAAGWRGKCDQAENLCSGCHLRERGCLYYDAMRKAKRYQHVVTNYAKWLSGDQSEFGPFDVMICDEAHDAVDQLSKSLRVELSAYLVDRFCDSALPGRHEMEWWNRWAQKQLLKLRPRLEGLAASVMAGNEKRVKELQDLRGLVKSLETIACAGADWVEDRAGIRDDESGEKPKTIGFEPVWPQLYGGKLFGSIGKVVLGSATVTRKDAQLLGIADEDMDFAEYPSSFPVERRLVMSIPTVRQSSNMTDQERAEAVRRIDQIIDGRLDRKGIIDTVSFARAREIVRLSRHAHLMMTNLPERRDGMTQSEWTAYTVSEFRKRQGPWLLVGPSFSTGWDFDEQDIAYGIAPKVGFINRHDSEVAAARCKSDDQYDGWQAMKRMQQFGGRGMRKRENVFELFVTDNMWGDWFLKRNRRHAAQYFLEACRQLEMSIPAAPGLEVAG